MKWQASFTFDGLHNQKPIANFLRTHLKDVKFKIETISRRTYKIYVSSSEDADKTLQVCNMMVGGRAKKEQLN